MGDIKAAKKAARAIVLARRGREGNQVKARAAMKHAAALVRDSSVARVSLYAGFGDELDPMPLVCSLWRVGYDVGLPVVVAPRQPLIFRRYGRDIRWTLSGFGIREPADTVAEVVPDLVLAPLVGIDRRGVRLGYGGGFYDRTIAAWRAQGHRPAIFGLAFEAQLVSRLPQDRYDVRLDGLVTEAGIRRFR